MKSGIAAMAALLSIVTGVLHGGSKFDAKVLLRDIAGAEKPGAHHDSLNQALERNVFRLKSYCDSLMVPNPSLLESLSEAYGSLAEQYRLRRIQASGQGAAQSSLDSLDHDRSMVLGLQASTDSLLSVIDP